MKRVTLSPGEPKRYGVGKEKWLVVREAAQYIFLQSEDLAPIRLDAGDKLYIEGMKAFELVNPHAVEISVICQLSDRDIYVQPSTEVQISTAVAVTEIRRPVATQELVAQNFDSHDHITILPNDSQRLVFGSATRKELMITNLSDMETEAMIGGQAVSAVNGLPLSGSRDEPGHMILTVGAEVWAFNNGQFPLKLALAEVHQ